MSIRIPHLAALFISALFSVVPALAGADALLDNKLSQTSNPNDPPVIYLGTIAVGGQKEVMEALQDIKVALEQPLSNDPRLADVVVCRLTDDIGTHAKQLLICGTNRVLNQNKELLQTAMQSTRTDPPAGGDSPKGSSSACASASCYESSISILNESLENMRRHYLKQQVNGASLHAVLANVPYPTQVVPAAATNVAPAAATSHV